MMVNCPKCGFSQPEDQYCAKCGVNMIAFRARHKAIGTRLIANPKFQVSVLAVIMVIAGLYVRSSNQARAARLAIDTPIERDVDQQETELAKAQTNLAADRKQMNETNSASVAPPPPPAQASLNAPPQVANPSGGGSASAPPASSAASANPPSASAPAAGIRSALQPSQNVRVYFIEIERGLLSGLLNDAHDGSGDGASEGAVSYGVIANLEQRLKAARGWQSLDSLPDQQMRLNQPNMFIKGAYDRASGQTIGLSVRVVPVSRDEAGAHLQIDANRTLRDPSVGIDSFNFQLPDNFMLPKGSSFILAGVLPHRALGPDEQTLYHNVNILKPMMLEPFMRQGPTGSEVAIIVEAH